MANKNVYVFIQLINLLIIILFSKISSDINIHVIPHTHMDPGWLKTPEEYYSEEAIEEIFNTVLNELTKDNSKTFVMNELYYFKIWYSSRNEEDKMKFKKLLQGKRIEFVSGSYVINDEATPLYYNIIDQIRIGHQFLLEEFGITPKTGWYVDSFGHSAGNAHILAQMNFEYLVLGRIHLDFLDLMKNEKKTEFYWDPFGNNNSNKKILTHILALHYGYELYLQDLGLPNEEFKNNLNNIIDNLIYNFKEIMKGIRHNNIMYLYGDDFKHKDNNLFLNIDSLINLFIKNSTIISKEELKSKFGTSEKINIFYSTPEKYFESVKKELKENNKNLDTYTNIDFFPLRSDCFWTGFFTSRPYLKGYIRKGSNIFYSLSKYHSFNKLINEYMDYKTIDNLNNLREVVGLSQHHDAITGTCMQYVSTDYINRLKTGIENGEKDFIHNIQKKYKFKINKICYNNYIVDENNCSKEFLIPNNKNEKEINIGIYNPIFSSSFSEYNNLLINIEMENSEYEYEIEGIKSDFFCINENSIDNTDIYKYNNKCFLNFFYQFKKGEELALIKLIKSSTKLKNSKYFKFNKNKEEKIELIKNDINIQSLTFSPKNFEFNLEYLNEEQKINKIDFTYYDGMYYVNAGACTDGAYIFSPYNKYPDEIEIDYNNSFYYKGNLGITFVTRNIMTSFTLFTIFYDPFFIKVEHLFDSLDTSYFLKRFSFGYSFVLKTNINNLDKDQKPIFYTDANGLEMMKRTIDKFEFKETAIPWAGGNFYPVTSFISIQDENNNENKNKNKITIFNDRPQSGTGYQPGSIILILQRMSYGNDNKGLTESMYETESMNTNNFKTTHLIVFGININKNEYKEHSKYMIQKTNLLNFIYNYMNTATLLFQIFDNNSTFIELKDKFTRDNELKNKMINEYLKISPDIRANYELINNNLIIGEYFRYNNYFFNIDNNENNDIPFGTILMNFEHNPKFKIYYDKTGINYNKKDGNIVNNDIKSKLFSPKSEKLTLQNNEFLYIYFYLEN